MYVNFLLSSVNLAYCKRKGYNIDVINKSACLAVDPIKVENFAYVFNCTPFGRSPDSMMTPN